MLLSQSKHVTFLHPNLFIFILIYLFYSNYLAYLFIYLSLLTYLSWLSYFNLPYVCN